MLSTAFQHLIKHFYAYNLWSAMYIIYKNNYQIKIIAMANHNFSGSDIAKIVVNNNLVCLWVRVLSLLPTSLNNNLQAQQHNSQIIWGYYSLLTHYRAHFLQICNHGQKLLSPQKKTNHILLNFLQILNLYKFTHLCKFFTLTENLFYLKNTSKYMLYVIIQNFLNNLKLRTTWHMVSYHSHEPLKSSLLSKLGKNTLGSFVIGLYHLNICCCLKFTSPIGVQHKIIILNNLLPILQAFLSNFVIKFVNYNQLK